MNLTSFGNNPAAGCCQSRSPSSRPSPLGRRRRVRLLLGFSGARRANAVVDFQNKRRTILPLPGGPRSAKRSSLFGKLTRGGLGKPLGWGEGESDEIRPASVVFLLHIQISISL